MTRGLVIFGLRKVSDCGLGGAPGLFLEDDKDFGGDKDIHRNVSLDPESLDYDEERRLGGRTSPEIPPEKVTWKCGHSVKVSIGS